MGQVYVALHYSAVEFSPSTDDRLGDLQPITTVSACLLDAVGNLTQSQFSLADWTLFANFKPLPTFPSHCRLLTSRSAEACSS